ncbi:helix-turn-helix domain-containing protein [Paenibacillus sp. 1P07SE]|uniref:helix-turn-helix domain-containing protein n=1 Tax=Paenibacillus sp. 1P07SE TaxID=3132209 RepID=UPI0039A60CF4
MTDLSIFNELSEHIQLRIHSCKIESHNREWSESKLHPDYDFWLITDGSVLIQSETGTHTAYAGDVIFFYPNAPYTATTTEAGCRFLYLHFEFGIGEHFRILNDFNFSGIVAAGDVVQERELLLQAYQAYEAHEPVASLSLKGALQLLLSRVIQLRDSERAGVLFQHSGQSSNLKLSALRPVIAYIHDHLDRPITVSELAAMAAMSEKYFIPYFRKAVGLTPGRYINQLRMNRARDYLQEGQYSVKQIAALLGYPDAYTFSKAFKKHYHVAPSKFG